jgi:predicted deacetylase
MLAVSCWKALADELDAWRQAGRCAELWLRDDDAGRAEAPLVQLVELCGEYQIPANFAAIPTNSVTETADLFDNLDNAFVLVHGYAHTDHAGTGERKTEFSSDRATTDVEKEWGEGLRLIEEIYGPKALRVFVPPWNRMAYELKTQLAGAGFTGYSGLGARTSEIEHKLTIANVHVDMIDSRRRAFRGSELTLASVVRHLQDKRAGRADPTEPTGVMTHHLVFDEESWLFLRQLFATTSRQDGVCWRSGGDIFGLSG